MDEKDIISPILEDNLKRIETFFVNCQDISIHPWRYGPELEHTAFSVHFRTLIDKKKDNFMKVTLQDLVAHVVDKANTLTPKDVMIFFERQGVSSQTTDLVDDYKKAVEDILNGHVIIFFAGWDKALSYQAFGVKGRQVDQPVSEPVVQGPREGTVENLEQNIGLLRRRLKNHRLKIESFTAGRELKVEIAFGYLDGTVNPETLVEFKQRIGAGDFEQQDILGISYIEDWIEDSSYSPFPQHRQTERPDVAVAALLDGKIIAMADGSPQILICPAAFVEFFTTNEDYFQRTLHATAIRLLRIIAFFMALMLPSIYVAFSTFHPELFPTVLLLATLDTREGIPFPTLVEVLLMEFFFELLREAGIRLPKPIGSAVTIVGALIIGEAAIQARIASPLMIIVVSVTGIASFAIPQYSMAVALRLLRFPLAILAGTLGGFGLMIGFLWIILHLICLRSLGQPYLTSLAPLEPSQLLDVLVRMPLKTLLRFPRNRHMHKSHLK